MTAPRLLVSASIGAVLLAGCGGGNDSPAAGPSSAGAASSAASAAPAPSVGTPSIESAAPSGSSVAPSAPAAGSGSAAPSGPYESTPAGQPNGVEQLGADEILARSREAASRASSLRIKGDITSQGKKTELDIRTKTTEGTGSIAVGGQKLDLRLIGEDVYVQGDEAFYNQYGGAAAGKLLEGKWLKGRKDDPKLGQLSTFFSIPQLTGNLLKPRSGLQKGEQTSVAGQRAIVVKDSNGTPLYIALDGEPYPLRTEAGPKDKGAGRIDFTGWNKDLTVQAPPASDVVDASKLGSSS